ncbi:hypothetical protein G6F70_004278 [Rhizopus microsporus]|uniref:EF-hand n=1 Tax=Rhizopus microsporus TaxID=58291 RepID=A0A1X0S787_RHIZD|nr:hypothetical protein G6F71_001253 [Rhizopus microsporus]KAG1200164.1 hypothetical protein G6F70_004278 [Rhizopus microsporus]KAG1215976.1 hypothetical protein G6F69_000506 [Rhizopus microsporus]KAG1234323.1 hypothetical protein G6F67_003621 [Rhizopus microsporus]KAG1261973.1 hypothetical protein G6F68_006283 [Rhizopus microsporus]
MKKQSKRQLEKIFNRCDIEETGYLNSEALYQALLMLKLPVQLTDIEDILDSVGRKKEGTIGIDDFINIVHELQAEDTELDKDDEFIPEEQEESKAQIVFDMLADTNVDGITLDSLMKVCAAEEPSWTQQQIMEMLNEADMNHDGIIDLNEFEMICKRIGIS